MTEPITEADLNAYIDGCLTPARRIDVEAYLALHPEVAAELMDSMRQRDEIRMFLAAPGTPPLPATVSLARRLGRALRLHAALPVARSVLVAASLLCLGWFGHATFGVPDRETAHAADPSDLLADDAVQAFHVTELKASLLARPPVASAPDRAAGAALPLTVPLPPGYRRIAVDDLPWAGGIARFELLAAPGGETMVLLVAETDTYGTDRPELESAGGITTVSWWDGRYAYALSGDVPAAALMAVVRRMESLG